ncbi:MAG: transcriptional regulator [Phycisphaeraceae bacterium]
MADYSKMYRLLRMLTLMQQGDAGNAVQLAQQLNVADRTVYRDIATLAELGVPCYFDEDANGYRVRRDFFLPPVQLTSGETLALLCLAERVGGNEQIALTGAAARAVEKIKAQLPPAVVDELGDVHQHVDVHLPASGPAGESIRDVFGLVQQAIRQRRALRCRYESLNSDTNNDPFLLRPYHLVFDQRAWYVIGHHEGRGEVRRLKLNRFSAIKPTDTPYMIPDDFSLADYRGKAWRMIRGDQTYQVRIAFNADVADTVSDTHWHPTQAIDYHDDGSITFHCEVDGLDEIVWWILGYGPHARVHEPAELAERVGELVKATAEQYGPAVTKGAALSKERGK